MKKMLWVATIFLSLVLLLVGCTTEQPSGNAVEDVSRLNGVELSSFTIVYAEDDAGYAQRAAAYIRSEILARTGIELPLVEDSEECTAEYEIVVGETEREISARLDADMEKSQFAILAEEKQIALEGEDFVIAAAAYYFVATYVPEDDYGARIPMEAVVHDPIAKKANNHILLIGDGMGLYQTLLFDMMEDVSGYSNGEDTFYGYYLPYMGLARTNSLDGTTDSAAAGTALSCGVKTHNRYVGKDGERSAVQSITELAASLSKATAVMSTDSSTGATPAAFSAHANDRDDAAVILEDQRYLTEEGGVIVNCGFNAFDAEGVAALRESISETLNELSQNDNGFFLMYEEAHIDKYCHNNDAANAFLAVLRFNQAISVFMEYALYHPDTMVIITADHETGALLPGNKGAYVFGSENHSSHYVPVFAFGAEADVFDETIIENVQIPRTIAALWGETLVETEDDFPALVQ